MQFFGTGNAGMWYLNSSLKKLKSCLIPTWLIAALMHQSALRSHPRKPQYCFCFFWSVSLLPCQPCKRAWYIWELSLFGLGFRASLPDTPCWLVQLLHCFCRGGILPSSLTHTLSHPSHHEVTLRMSANHIYLVCVHRAILIWLEIRVANLELPVVWLHINASYTYINVMGCHTGQCVLLDFMVKGCC